MCIRMCVCEKRPEKIGRLADIARMRRDTIHLSRISRETTAASSCELVFRGK